MTGKYRLSRWLVGAAMLAAVDCGGLVAVDGIFASPAHAQGFPFFGGGRQQQKPRSGGGFFGGLFGGFDRPSDSYEQQAPVDNSRAPLARKPDAKAEPVTPTTSIVVLGDAMADWLAYGMEDAFSDSPEI